MVENQKAWGHQIPPHITDSKLFDQFYYINSTSNREFTEEHRRVFTAESTGKKETLWGLRGREGEGAMSRGGREGKGGRGRGEGIAG